MRADLHTHTLASDGALRPAQLIRSAATRRLTHLAICDHDSLAAYDALTLDFPRDGGLAIVPGIDISAFLAGGEVHILGLGFDLHHLRLRRVLTNLLARRQERLASMFDKLVTLGCFRRYDESQRAELRTQLILRPEIQAWLPPTTLGPSACRLHLAHALLVSGDCQSLGEVFARYLGDNGSAYVPYARYPGEEAIETIHEAGGVALLAHPALYRERWDSTIRAAAAAGAQGVELNHPKQKPGQREAIDNLARGLGLPLRTGGSDFHSFESPLGPRFGKEIAPEAYLEQLFAMVQHPRFTSSPSVESANA